MQVAIHLYNTPKYTFTYVNMQHHVQGLKQDTALITLY